MAVRDIFGRPALERRLVICTGPCCDGQGQASLHLEQLRTLLCNEASDTPRPDTPRVDKGSCVRKSCLGKCTSEPLAYVQPDDVWYRGLSAENLLRIYEQHVLGGRAVAELILRDET